MMKLINANETGNFLTVLVSLWWNVSQRFQPFFWLRLYLTANTIEARCLAPKHSDACADIISTVQKSVQFHLRFVSCNQRNVTRFPLKLKKHCTNLPFLFLFVPSINKHSVKESFHLRRNDTSQMTLFVLETFLTLLSNTRPFGKHFEK